MVEASIRAVWTRVVTDEFDHQRLCRIPFPNYIKLHGFGKYVGLGYNSCPLLRQCRNAPDPVRSGGAEQGLYQWPRIMSIVIFIEYSLLLQQHIVGYASKCTGPRSVAADVYRVPYADDSRSLATALSTMLSPQRR